MIKLISRYWLLIVLVELSIIMFIQYKTGIYTTYICNRVNLGIGQS